MGNISIKIADITTLQVDAIVNAANSGLQRGGGVCGAIFSAAGVKELEKECEKYNGCPTGSAVITGGCHLPAHYVIHAVGPVWRGGQNGEAELLYNCYDASLRLAMENGCHSIAFPVISSGIFGYPKFEAWRTGFSACICFFSQNPDWEMDVTFAVLNNDNRQIGIAALENLCKQGFVDGINLEEYFQFVDETPKKKWDKFNNSDLVEVFQDTISFCRTDPYLKAETRTMQAGTMLYLSDYESTLRAEKSNEDHIEVVGISTYAAARKYASEGKVAVLNFANAFHPGGGVTHGSLAQEEGLCRSSNLYLGLDRHYLRKHYYDYNERHGSAMGSDSVIYLPGVTVFKNDGILAEMLPREEWYQTDVITCAAPKFVNPALINNDKLYRLHVNRGRNILEAAMAHDIDVIVLGAFGCGAFKNPPAVVAESYRDLLVTQGYARYFKKVVFAILHDHNDRHGNYDAFADVFGQ